MTVRHIVDPLPAAFGLRAMKGGAVTVAVALDKGEPRVVLSAFLPTAAETDRQASEPYHVAAEMPRGPDGGATPEIVAMIARARERQQQLADAGLRSFIRKLENADVRPTAAALLVNRAGWVTDLLAYSLAYTDHPPVAEGLAVRETLRFAIAENGLALAEVDEKSLPELASEVLAITLAALETSLKTLGAGLKPWRKEEKLACLAAWLELARKT